MAAASVGKADGRDESQLPYGAHSVEHSAEPTASGSCDCGVSEPAKRSPDELCSIGTASLSTASASSSAAAPTFFFLSGTCGVHSRERRVHRVQGCLSSRSHLTFDRLHAAHARFTAFMSPSHGIESRTHLEHGLWLLHAVLARWQFLHAWSFDTSSGTTSSSLGDPFGERRSTPPDAFGERRSAAAPFGEVACAAGCSGKS